MPDGPNAATAPPGGAPPGGPASPLRRLFVGSRGLRAGWGFALFVGLLALAQVVIGFVWDRFLEPPPDVPWTPVWTALDEAASFGAALFAIAILSRLERRSLAEYGLALRRIFGRRFWEGALWGLAMVTGVVALLWAVGSYSVRSLNLHGTELLAQALLWALAFLMVGLAEETLFRSYALYTLGRGLGFWPAAVALSAVFGALHYFLKPGETWIDGASTGLLALFICLTIRRTGDIGLAVGFHFAFNYAALFLFGGSNSGNGGQPLPSRLLDASFQGPQWLTGGPMGPEASVFIFLVLALAFPLFHFRHRAVRFLGPTAPRGASGSTSQPPEARVEERNPLSLS